MAVDLSPRAYYSCSISPAFGIDAKVEGAVPVRVLLVDHDPTLCAANGDALRAAGHNVVQAFTTAEASQQLSRDTFDVVLARVGDSGVDGYEILRIVQSLELDVPVILMSPDADVDLARQALRLGAGDFVTASLDGGELAVVIERNLVRQSIDRRRAHRQRTQLEDSNEKMLEALLCALDFRSAHTEEHTESVAACSIELARQLGFSDREMYDLERGALLHDIGKIGMPDDVLHKPGRLTDEEWEEMRKHPVIGYRMCSKIGFLKRASEIVLRHHEHWDGRGYPDGVAGCDIPVGARVLAVVDAFHAMTSDRPYRSAMSTDAAASELKRCRGTQFDPEVVDAFLAVPMERWLELRRKAEQAARR